MKRGLICFVLLIGTIAFLSGCDPDNPFGDKGIMGEKKGIEILGYIESDNSDALKDMFCNALKNSVGFDEKIDEIMHYIDGKIVSYDIPSGSGGYGPTWERLEPTFYNIETDKGGFYKIGVSIYIKNENPDKLGINSLHIYRLGEKDEYGYRVHLENVGLYTE